MITGRQLAALMSEQLEAGNWGTIDPAWFKIVAKHQENAEDLFDPDDLDDSRALLALLDTVAQKISAG